MAGTRIAIALVAGGCHFTAAEPVDDGPATIDASGGSDTPAGCPATYTDLPGQPHLYRLIATAADWTTQRTACASDAPRAYLAIPDDATELLSLDGLASPATRYWVGIDDLATTGAFETVLNTTQTFLPWAAGQPASGVPPQDCVAVLSQTAELETDRCSLVGVAVCECEP